jgi:hypothetical protein
LGDFLDRRKFVNFLTLNAVQNGFVKRLEQSGAKMHCILGNHDIFYKNKSEVNSLQELFSDRFVVHDTPKVLDFDGLPIAMLPWINKENEGDCLDFIRTAPADILCGHLELHGFNVLRNTPFDGGMNADLFKRYSAVYTGHFHCRHSRDNVHYLGCPYQITMNDYGDKKGFHVLDTDTGDLEFIPNPYRLFHKIFYDDVNTPTEDILNLDLKAYKNTFIKIIIKNKSSPSLFDTFIDNIERCEPVDIQVVEDHLNLDIEVEKDIIDEAEDTITILNKFVDSLNTKIDKNDVKKVMLELYNDALNTENV